jgi:hypothetical protein
MPEINLQGWVFTYNPYIKTWLATKRENYNNLFNGDWREVLKSKDITTLTAIITRTGGDKKKIAKLLK